MDRELNARGLFFDLKKHMSKIMTLMDKFSSCGISGKTNTFKSYLTH
jgi:hypothetical protein